MAAAIASRGFQVVGLDTNREFVGKINAGIAPVAEPRLQEFITRNHARIRATHDWNDAICTTEITCVIVPTPSEPNGEFSLKYALAAAEQIGRALRKKRGYHVVCLTSTVLPGATEARFIPSLEKAAGRKSGRTFGISYNPEFIALGSVIHDLLHPDFVLIGEHEQKTGAILESFYRKLVAPGTPIRRMTIVNAEITKIALNTFITTKISYANMLAEVCEHIPGANVDEVTGALGCDSRIGARYLRGGLGYAGPCFPRDNRAFTFAAKQYGANLPLAEATELVNRHQIDRMLSLISSIRRKGDYIGILGLSYKPDSSVIDESPGVLLATLLSSQGAKVLAYDPLAVPNARRAIDHSVTFATSAKECARHSDVLVILTPWPEFGALVPTDLKRSLRRPRVIDCWRMLSAKNFSASADYIAIGVYSDFLRASRTKSNYDAGSH